MAIHIRGPEADRAVRELAAALGVSLTEAIRVSAENEMKRVAAARRPLRERIKRIQDHIASFEPTGLKADKAFYDELSGDV